MIGLFRRSELSSDQISKIAKETGCSRSVAKKRGRIAANAGLDANAFMESGLYKMPAIDLTVYLRRKSPRDYAKLFSDRGDVSEYDAYSQLERAKDVFDIPYSAFAKRELIGAPDSRLEEVREELLKKRDRQVSKIAQALHVSEDEAQSIVDRIQEKYGYSPSSIYRHQLYKMSDDELKSFKREGRTESRDLEKKILERTGWTPRELSEHKKHCSVDYGIDLAVYYACHCFEMTDDELAQLGNMRDSKTLSAVYNRGHSGLLADKSKFNEVYSDFVGRKSWVNRDTDFEEFEAFAEGLDEVFCKPLDLSTGTGTFKKALKGVDLKDVYEWFMEQPVYLVEECIVQHPDMAQFYPGSLNTVRLFTILYNDEFEPFASFVRFGVGGVTDNYSSGGIACGVDPKTGIILTNGSNEEDERFETHPLSGVKFKGFQIPHWDLVLERAEEALRLVDGVNYVGWDVAIRDNDVVFVEGNSVPDLGVQQALFTEEGEFIRDIYKKYLDGNMYEDMQGKTRQVMKLAHCSERKARGRLVAAFGGGIDYKDFIDKELYKLTDSQVRRYAQDAKSREIAERLATDNGVPAGDAFLALRHAELRFDISFERFYDENMFGSSDEKLRENS